MAIFFSLDVTITLLALYPRSCAAIYTISVQCVQRTQMVEMPSGKATSVDKSVTALFADNDVV
jgi:hypothetical protein